MGRKGEREKSLWSTALMAGAALVLGWATMKLAFKPFLQAGRDGINRSLDPDYDPDDELEAPSSAPKDIDDDDDDEEEIVIQGSSLEEKAKDLPTNKGDL